MRIIKFRIWDGKNMHYPETDYCYLLQWTKNRNFYIGTWSLWKKCCNYEKKIGEEFDKKPFILMQYTGLKDEKRKDIYENDIIRLSDEKIGIVSYSDCYLAVLFYLYDCKKTISRFKNKRIKYEYFPNGSCYYSEIRNLKIKVIGNIFENKKLAKKFNLIVDPIKL
jgi:uncharacterized phage protein (TIGR01671 family)